MTEKIIQVDIDSNSVISGRTITSARTIVSIDVDQTSGDYLTVEPFDADGTYGGRVMIRPASTTMSINEAVELQTFSGVGDLYYPLDARFDYVRRKIWIADTGNHRILKVDMNSSKADVNIDDVLLYPHALASNLNSGGVFVKGYLFYDKSIGAVVYFKSNGEEEYRFVYTLGETQSSSSSSTEGTMSSSSSSTEDVMPVLPVANSIVYDHVRSRAWWIEGLRVYMVDERSQQVQTYDINESDIVSTISLDLELSSGNILVVTEDNHNERLLVQINRDNNLLLAVSYIEE